MKNKIRNIIYHVISVAFLLVALLFSVFRFGDVFFRTIEAIRDLALSVAYFILEWFKPLQGVIDPTVIKIPKGALELLPFTWEEFLVMLEQVGNLLIDRRNFFLYLRIYFEIGNAIEIIAGPIILLLMILFVVGCFVYKAKPKKQKQKQGPKPQKKKKRRRKKRAEVPCNSSGPYAVFYRFQNAVLMRIWNFIKRYTDNFLRCWKWYRTALILVWMYNLNVFTIIIEVFAYIIYLCKSNDFLSLYTQFVKLVLDLSVAVRFLPGWLQVIVGVKIFHSIRCWIGKKKLRAYVNKLVEWLEKVPGSIFINGKQRMRKTTLLTVLSVIEAIRMRKNAKARLKERSKQFPHFPWRTLERSIREARKAHVCYTLASTREFIRSVEDLFKKQNKFPPALLTLELRRLRKKGYCGDNLIFGYKYKRFPMTYNDGIRIIDIWEAIENYARSYFIYATPTPLIFGNYSIRSDEKKISVGNFERYNFDFFNRDPKDMKRDSQYCHYAVMDSMRLGKLMNPENPYKDALEFGVVAMTEFEKEVGNQHTNSAYKVDASSCNRKNDGLSNFLKTCTHMSTVDNETQFRFICDGHRPGSMSSDYAELCTLWRLKKRSDSKIVLPFFAIEGSICRVLMKGYDWIEDKMSYLQGKRTLFMYILDTIHGVVFRHYDRIKKMYSVYTSTTDIWDGTDDEMIKKNAKLVVPEALAFGDRFATDSWGEYYHEKVKRSKYGIDDVPMFKTKKMSFEEMQAIGSHIYNELGELMLLEKFLLARKQRDEWLIEYEKKKKGS